VDVLIERCAGLDVHLKTVAACVRRPGVGRRRAEEVKTFRTFSADLVAMGDWLAEQAVTHVAMEATGVYWKPVWYALEGRFELVLANARHVKAVPGRKTDVRDSAWLAQLLECGLVRSSFVPPPIVRELRDLTRYRKRLIQAHTSEAQRIDKVLEDANIKLAAVASKTLGVSGRSMLDALVNGERDPQVLAGLARGRLRAKHDDLASALIGRVGAHHVFMLRGLLDHVDYLTASIARLDDAVAARLVEHRVAVDRLVTIPGVGIRAAEVIVAEIGFDMAQFASAAHLASWAGMCPGNNESAGKRFTGKTRKGDVWLRDVLVECAWGAARTKDTNLSVQFWRLTRRLGQQKAAVAVGHSLLVIAYHVLRDEADYHELGGDFFVRRTDTRFLQQRLVRQLEQLGNRVTLEPVDA
jgi:transposase